MMKKFHIETKFEPQTGLLSLFCDEEPDCRLTDSPFSVVIMDAREEVSLQMEKFSPVTERSWGDGMIQSIQLVEKQSFRWRNESYGLEGILDVALPIEKQSLLCRMRLVNTSNQTLIIQSIEMIRAGNLSPILKSKIKFSNHDQREDLAFFSNGWQSWSFSGVYGANEKQHRTKLSFIPNADSSNPGTPKFQTKGHFTGEMFGVLGNRKTRKGLLCGFLSQEHHFGSLEVDLRRETGLRIWAQGDQTLLKPGESMETDWLCLSWINMDDPHAMQPYIDLVAIMNHARVKASFPNGWCSWYQYATNISAEKILANTQILASLKSELPLELVQIDDGFQLNGGDWFDFQPLFPKGVASVGKAICKENMMPGLWLAPFIVSVGAQLIKDHPDYLLRNHRGKPVSSGFISNKLSNALDLSYPPALEYASRVIDTAVKEWEFPYLKLDFLYAGALNGRRYDYGMTRAQILRQGLEALRKTAGEDTFLLGCGVPLGSAIGLFDGMRIGADTAGSWKPKLFNIPILLNSDPQLPSTRNAIQNSISRSFMHSRWWVNDPDCLLLRPDTDLSLEELKTHASLIAMSGGALLISDDLTKLPVERIKLASKLLPLIGKQPKILDWFDRLTPRYLRLDLEGEVGKWNLLAYFNWADLPEHLILQRKDFLLDNAPLIIHSFWESQNRTSKEGDILWEANLPAHGCLVLAARNLLEFPQYLGSDIHISQGLEVKNWQLESQKIRFQIDVGHNLKGSVFLRIPSMIRRSIWEGQECIPDILADEIYQFKIQTENVGWLEIDLV